VGDDGAVGGEVKVERSTEIGAAPERVYEVVMDPRRLEDWVSIHESLIEAPRGELKEGAELVQCLKLAGRRFNVHWKVVEDDCPNRVVWEGQGPVHSHAKVIYGLERNGDGGTRFSYMNQYDLPGGPLGRLAGRTVAGVARKEADKSLERLKKLLE
jgi:carbon monoxide dehydrogenase subunit G